MNALTQLLQWTKARPFHAIALTALTSVVATCWATEAFNTGFLIAAALVTVLLTMLVIWRTPVLVAMLSVAFASSSLAAPDPEPAVQPAGPVVAGAVVVVVGGVAIVYFVKFCQKHFPKTTNATPSLSLDGDESDTYAAAWSYMSLGSCYLPGTRLAVADGTVQTPQRVELSGIMEDAPDGPRFRLNSIQSAPTRPGETQDFSSWNEGLRSHGIHWPESVGRVVYGRNGLPATADAVPVSFDTDARTITIGRGVTRPVTLERSADLQQWDPVATVNVAPGQAIRFVDLSATEHLFYRLR